MNLKPVDTLYTAPPTKKQQTGQHSLLTEEEWRVSDSYLNKYRLEESNYGFLSLYQIIRHQNDVPPQLMNFSNYLSKLVNLVKTYQTLSNVNALKAYFMTVDIFWKTK